jgi:hypothetical protein
MTKKNILITSLHDKKSRNERNINVKSEYKKLNMSRIKKKDVSKKY